MSLRYRLASRLLGYRPIHIPDKDGNYIVHRTGIVSMVVTAKTLSMEMTNRLPSFDELEAAEPMSYDYFESTRSGTFSGTFSGTL